MCDILEGQYTNRAVRVDPECWDVYVSVSLSISVNTAIFQSLVPIALIIASSLVVVYEVCRRPNWNKLNERLIFVQIVFTNQMSRLDPSDSWLVSLLPETTMIILKHNQAFDILALVLQWDISEYSNKPVLLWLVQKFRS